MKVAEFLKRTGAVLASAADELAARSALEWDERRSAAALYAEWHERWADAQRAFRATHGPAVRVPGPRQLGLSWPPPHNPNAGITLNTEIEHET